MANADNYTDATDTDFKGTDYGIEEGNKLSAESMRNALHTKENVANKQMYSTDAAGTLSSNSSDSYYPSAKLIGANFDTLRTELTNELQAVKDSLDILPVGTIIMYDGTNWADNATLPGWYACTSANAGKGCPDLISRFIKGTDHFSKFGTAGNTNHEVQIMANHLPAHSHNFSTTTNEAGEHTHPMVMNPIAGGNTYGINVSTCTPVYHTYMLSAGSHNHPVSGTTDENTTTGIKLNIEPQSYALIFIRKCYA
ncbi:MAG: hypothetical protein LBJ25_01450 [Candidatus Margulisbacteria bacterium]|jgi:hypothetical protein|nr:hypothetical protein [Candidatus Margulisiibacteriota bacterium]